MTSTPVYMIEAGDVITFGFGSLSISHNVVTEITERMTDNGTQFIFALDNEKACYRYDGEWLEVTKSTPDKQRTADAAAEAYARAWDNKR